MSHTVGHKEHVVAMQGVQEAIDVRMILGGTVGGH